MRPSRPTPAHQTDRLAELVCSNSLKSDQESTAPWLLKEELRRLDSLLLKPHRRRACPADTRSPSTAKLSPPRSRAAIDGRAAHRIAPRRGVFGSGGRHRHHRHRPADQRRAGRGDRAPHRLRTASSFTTASAPSSTPRPSTPASRSGPRATANPPTAPTTTSIVRSTATQYERFVDELLAAQSRLRAHPRGSALLLRSLPADRRDGAPRPRHAALRSHEADGTHRSAHWPPPLGRGAIAPGKSARPQLQPGRVSESYEVRRAGAHPAPDSRPGEAPNSCASARSIATPTSTRLRCSRHAATARAAATSSSPARFPAWKATWNRSPPA